nr:MAG TPA: hypothetical protein [Caudoviricetes sp.]
MYLLVRVRGVGRRPFLFSLTFVLVRVSLRSWGE